jgi:hypothetical protein
MHPVLTRYVDPPQRHKARYIALGAAVGTLGLIIALGVVALVDHASLTENETRGRTGPAFEPDDQVRVVAGD